MGGGVLAYSFSNTISCSEIFEISLLDTILQITINILTIMCNKGSYSYFPKDNSTPGRTDNIRTLIKAMEMNG